MREVIMKVKLANANDFYINDYHVYETKNIQCHPFLCTGLKIKFRPQSWKKNKGFWLWGIIIRMEKDMPCVEEIQQLKTRERKQT